MLTDKQIADFQKHYQTESERFNILPPGIYPDRKYSQQILNARQVYRQKNGLSESQNVLLQVGSDFTRKGVDRTLARDGFVTRKPASEYAAVYCRPG